MVSGNLETGSLFIFGDLLKTKTFYALKKQHHQNYKHLIYNKL